MNVVAPRSAHAAACADRCRICGAVSTKVLYPYQHFNVIKCEPCGFIQVDREPTGELLEELYGKSYFLKANFDEDGSLKFETKRRLRLLEQAGLPAGARVLEVGCATGAFLAVAHKKYEIWGHDYSEFAVKVAADRLPHLRGRLQFGRIEDAAYPDGHFDAIVMWDTIEHIFDPSLTIAALSRLIRPGGAILISSPNIGAPIAKIMGRRWAFMTPPEHLSFFSQKTIAGLLTGHGFEVKHSSTRGKAINAAFLLYKAGRVFPGLVPAGLVSWAAGSFLRKIVLYVPTGDVQYVSAIRRADGT